MTACVFVGPSLSRTEAAGQLDAVYLPPVQQGDLYRAVQRWQPRCIGIVDGYFQHAPSVWHKEILWAMAQGTHVLGAASMGALRAAELAPFGMIGVGKIFQAFLAGTLAPYAELAFEDDDEVAVVHGPADAGYPAVSEAMVNIRLSLAQAAAHGVISVRTRDALAAHAKEMFYADRGYGALLERGRVAGLPRLELDALETWLPSGRVDQKREDARALLHSLAELLRARAAPKQVDYRFEYTEIWRDAVADMHGAAAGAGADTGRRLRETLDELRLDPPAYREARDAAMARLTMLRESRSRDDPPERRHVLEASRQFLHRSGLLDRAAIDRWLADNDLSAAGYDRLMEDEARVRQAREHSEPALDDYLADHLRLNGRYPDLARRARHKRELAPGAAAATAPQPQPVELLAWYFEGHLRRPIPDDLRAYAREHGFADVDALTEALRAEFVYLSCGGSRAERGG